MICTYNLLKLPLISFSHSSPIQREREGERARNRTPHALQDGEGRRMNITSSKHSSGLNFLSCRRTDKYKHMYKHSHMTIPTSGTHLSGQHRCGWSRWGWPRCGWAVWGRGKAINQGPSIKFDTCWCLLTTHIQQHHRPPRVLRDCHCLHHQVY